MCSSKQNRPTTNTNLSLSREVKNYNNSAHNREFQQTKKPLFLTADKPPMEISTLSQSTMFLYFFVLFSFILFLNRT